MYVLGHKVGSLAATETVSVNSANPGVGYKASESQTLTEMVEMADAVKTVVAQPAGPVEAVKMKLEGEASEACVQATPLTVILAIFTVY